MTLFYMWLDVKAKDKMKDLQERIDKAIDYLSKEHYFEEEKKYLLNILKGDE